MTWAGAALGRRGPDTVYLVSSSELAGGQGDALAARTQRAARETCPARRGAAGNRDGGVRLWRVV
jgi:hypothetical protein